MNITKVLHIISDLRRGGRERQLSILSVYSNPEIENHIIAFHKVSKGYDEEYNFKRLNFIKGGKLTRIKFIFDYVKDKKIDLIHSWGNNETLYALPASRFHKIPIINGSIRHGIRLNSFSHLFRSFILNNSNYILGNSYEGFKVNNIKINKKKHFVIYNGIEEKFFVAPDEERKINLLKEKGINNRSFVFISIANFIPFKDYSTVLKALSEIKNQKISFHYFIVGKGPLLNEVKRKIRLLDLEENITILTDNPDIPSLLSVSDIMIHSSLGEGCSNAILEASAAGLIVVASDTGGTKEIINNDSFLFEYKNTSELITKLKQAMDLLKNNPCIRADIQSVTRQRFSTNALVDNYREVITDILKQKNV